MVKKNGKIRICVDFRNLNSVTPKDEYPMPMANQLIDAAAKNEILSFMDGHSGYNQIFIAEDDVNKTAFRCPGAIGTFKWVVMPFGLKNAGATYQQAMNAVFHDMIGKFMEVYIDDVVVKSATKAKHLADLRRSFERMRAHAGNFLGFLVHRRGIEVDKNKARAIIEAQPLRNKKELQRLIGQITYLGRFISNRAVKIHTFSPLLKLKSEEDFRWERHHQHVFESIKEYLANLLVLMPPRKKQPLKLYISVADESIGRYESLIIGLEILLKMRAQTVEIIGDSSLVINQLSSNFRCQSWHLKLFHSIAMQLRLEFVDVKVKHVYRSHNKEATNLTQIASGVRAPEGIMENLIRLMKRSLPSVKVREELLADVFAIEVEEDMKEDDRRTQIVDFLKNPDPKADRKLKIKALKFVMIDGDLFRKSIKDDLLLRFGIPESITTDRGSALIAKEVQEFAAEYGIKLLNLTLHFAQGNGQAESSNKTLKGIIEKMVEDNPRVWHELLSEALWAFRTSQRFANGSDLAVNEIRIAKQ
ncbi:uncharacterized protein LOC132270270 [Cornus florida]|uniref:uncharacterized protein LOC132270270 n=1 Tax=Cornus florida TaxID=4283 RepID=UPI00289DC3C4|nr:uncharacterized protein LOC132270270 [Cornus florida]